MKNIIIVILIILTLVFIWLWNGQKNQAEMFGNRLHNLQDSLSFSYQVIESSTTDINALKREKDSLFALVQSNSAKNAAPKYTPDQKAIHQLIMNVHHGWEDLFKTKDSEPFLNLFTSEYTTNEVTIDVENLPHVERHNNKDFEEHILALANTADLAIDFGETRFINTYVKDNIFTATYQTRLTVKEGYKTVQASDIICYMSGEKVDGTWKVGNYNWTRYNAMKYIN